MQKKSQDLETGMKLLYLIKGLIHLNQQYPQNKKPKEKDQKKGLKGFLLKINEGYNGGKMKENLLKGKIKKRTKPEFKIKIKKASPKESIIPKKASINQIHNFFDAFSQKKEDEMLESLKVDDGEPPGGSEGLKHPEMNVNTGTKFVRGIFDETIQNIERKQIRKNALRLELESRSKPRYVEIRERLLGLAYGRYGKLSSKNCTFLENGSINDKVAQGMIRNDRIFMPNLPDDHDLDKSIDHPIEFDAPATNNFKGGESKLLKKYQKVLCKTKKALNRMDSLLIDTNEGMLDCFLALNHGPKIFMPRQQIKNMFNIVNDLKQKQYQKMALP